MSTIKYLLDEHVNPRFRKALVRREPEMVVWCIGDVVAPPIQTGDPDILLWCEARGFSLVTNNRASMPVHLRDHLAIGRHVPGIFILNPNMTMGETIDELILIWAASDSDEYADQLRYLPVSS
ncbi:MAG: hypothetical protein CVU38_17290 [Chloroflexi bacterium HGW-Chloroflexi-1]|nr:MAG: hypothetical protein CVU38_17290 [Chloroflexi bacterium HGW-Chloroflexi-1]